MLTYLENDRKTYEERMTEAITDIPLYTSEWTNFNPSDPGITILETLLGFGSLQQESLNDIPFAVKQNLLKLVGFTLRKGKTARLLLSAENVREKTLIPANHKFRLGDMVFETNRQMVIEDRRLLGIYGLKNGEKEYTDFFYLTDREITVPAQIFGEKPAEGDCLYLISNSLPEAEKEMTFFFTLKERYNRNPVDKRTDKLFADILWECYTQEGWKKMDARDNTSAFLTSGEVRLWMPKEEAAVFTDAPRHGYAIRARLLHSEYDILPKVTNVDAFLFEVWQKDTICECHGENHAGEIELQSELAEEAYIDVYVREARGESYRKYEYSSDPEEVGRYYAQAKLGYGRYQFRFDRQRRQFAPEKGRDCVRIVVYTEAVMRRYSLGRVLGYDYQEIEIPFDHVVASSFCIVARRSDSRGGYLYDFVRPEKNGESDLYYHLLENDGKLIIEDAGRFIGADLFLASLAVTNGEEGNIREGNTLITDSAGGSIDPGIRFYNPGPGTGGAFREKLESLRKRFVEDMESPYTAVTGEDYERVVKTTPGLCIQKAKAEMDEARNLVKIAVKQGTDEEHPRLSEMYQRIIRERLEERRLLTTRVELVQPLYMPVNVTATVYTKMHFENAGKLIEDVIRQKIDYCTSDKNFGEPLRFDEIFHAIEMLDCVEYVYDLSLRPKSFAGAKMQDADVYPAGNCLLYPGEIRVDTVTFEGE